LPQAALALSQKINHRDNGLLYRGQFIHSGENDARHAYLVQDYSLGYRWRDSPLHRMGCCPDAHPTLISRLGSRSTFGSKFDNVSKLFESEALNLEPVPQVSAQALNFERISLPYNHNDSRLLFPQSGAKIPRCATLL
jgi:hypothetical protein